MKCDDFLPALETGGFWRRWQARRHATRCSRCAALRTTFDQAIGTWATAEPLAPRARQAWMQAAVESIHRPTRTRILRRAAAGFAVAACLVLALLIAVTRKDVAPPRPEIQIAEENAGQPGETRELGPITVEPIDPTQGLSRLAADVERLDAELQTLRRKAERLDCQQQIAATLEGFESRRLSLHP
jgi:hypothetical protein